MTNKSSHRISLRLALLVILLVAFVLRLYQLTAQSVWWDEGISLNLARLSLAEIVSDRLNNIHPPLYFFLLKFWTTFAGLNTFSARYLSVLASFLQVALVFAVCRRWFRRPFAASVPGSWIALLLITISPLSVIYGQEIRVYAMLPLVSLTLLAFAWQMSDRAPIKSRHFLWLGLVEWLGIHLHYVIAFVIAYVGFWLLLVFVRQHRWRDLRRFFWAQVIVGLASLPWFAAVLANWTAVQAEANTGTYLTDPVPIDFLLKQVWVFQLTGLAGSLARAEVWLAALLIILITAVLLSWRAWKCDYRHTAVRLLLQWILPMMGALLVWSVRSFSHPRYIAFTAVSFLVLAAFLIAPQQINSRGWRKFMALLLPGLLFACLVFISLRGLSYYFFDPNFSKDDMRAVARLLEETATADDLVIVPDTDWSLPFEYQGETQIVMPGLSQRSVMWADLAQWTAVPRRVFTVRYEQGNRDWQNVVPFVLEANGNPVQSWQIEDLTVREYQLSKQIEPPIFSPQQIQFGPLHLQGVWLEPEPTLDTAVALALRWQLEQTNRPYQVSLRLLDPDGFVLAEQSDHLLAEDGRPTNLWQPGQEVVTYHHIPLPPGSAAVPFRLGLSVFSVADGEVETEFAVDASGAAVGQQLVVAEGQLRSDTAVTPSVYGVPDRIPPLGHEIDFGDDLRLAGAVLERDELQPGETLFVHLQWLAERPLPPLMPILELTQDGEVLAASSTSATHEYYPSDLWQPGALVNDHRSLTIPATSAGTAVLTVSIGDEVYEIGQIEISGQSRQMTAPEVMQKVEAVFADVGQLVGFDLRQTTYSPGESIPLILYWQSGQTGGDVAYTVFVHVLGADGRILAQHDAPPANGQRPTPGWIEGEFITDPHTVALGNDVPAGPVSIVIGLYDPQTNERLRLPDGRDAYQLPIELVIIE